MTVLWFTTIRLKEESMFCSGTWIEGISDALLEVHPEVTLVNICTSSSIVEVVEEVARGRRQIVIPSFTRLNRYLLDTIGRLIIDVAPDVIEVWGTEGIWAQLPFYSIAPNVPCILAIQGLLGPVRDVVWGNLTWGERLQCVGVKEIICPRSSITYQWLYYSYKARRAESAIKRFDYISSQSKWVTAHIRVINPEAIILPMKIALRKAYYSASQWNIAKADPNTIFAVTGVRSPFKGLFILLKAFLIVHKQNPNAKLRVAGLYQYGLRRSGFQRMVERFVKNHNLQEHVVFLGELTTEQMINESQKASLYVNPSAVESYSLTTAENTFIGTPSLIAHVGSMPELDGNGSFCFHASGDYINLAYQITELLNDKNRLVRMSKAHIDYAVTRNDVYKVADNLVENYLYVIQFKCSRF